MISNERHAKLVELVYAHDYYVELFNLTRQFYIDRGMRMNTAAFWNDFWIVLPDNAAIRRAPFFEICDVAEGIYYADESETDM